MPAPGQISPTSLRTRLRDWLNENPGRHRPTEVAAGLGLETGPVANELARMARGGHIERQTLALEGRKQPVPLYSAPS